MGREKQSAPDVDEATSEQFSWSADSGTLPGQVVHLVGALTCRRGCYRYRSRARASSVRICHLQLRVLSTSALKRYWCTPGLCTELSASNKSNDELPEGPCDYINLD